MLWIGAQFRVCMFLDSRGKPLNMLKFVGPIKENERTKEEQREGTKLKMHKSAS